MNSIHRCDNESIGDLRIRFDSANAFNQVDSNVGTLYDCFPSIYFNVRELTFLRIDSGENEKQFGMQ